MTKKRRGLLGILFGQPVEKTDVSQPNAAASENVVPALDGDTLVNLIGMTLMQSITHLQHSSLESYNTAHFQYYTEFRNCLLKESFARYITGDVRERLCSLFNARPYVKILKELDHSDLEEGIKRTVVKYSDHINGFWEHYQEQHRKRRELQQAADQQEPDGTVQSQKKAV